MLKTILIKLISVNKICISSLHKFFNSFLVSGKWTTKFRPCERFVRNDLAEKINRSRRLASEQFLEFKWKLVLDPKECSFNEQVIISALQVEFEGDILDTQYFVQNKRLDFYFFEHKLKVGIDEYGYADRNFEYEQSRQWSKENLVVKLLELIQTLLVLTFTN